MGSIMLDKEQADKLKLDKGKMETRMQTIEKKLEESIGEICTPIVENHIMAYGTEFGSGLQILSFSIAISKFAIAALQEQGKLAKTIPGSSKKKDDEAVGQYL